MFKATINSTWPGLIMVFLGSLTLCLSIVVSGPLAPKIEVIDVPVFVKDVNPWRTGLIAGVTVSGSNGGTGEIHDEFPSLFSEENNQSEGDEK